MRRTHTNDTVIRHARLKVGCKILEENAIKCARALIPCVTVWISVQTHRADCRFTGPAERPKQIGTLYTLATRERKGLEDVKLMMLPEDGEGAKYQEKTCLGTFEL